MDEPSAYLCYRHPFSGMIARALFHALRAAGCDVFLGTDPIDLAQSEARAYFLVVITPALIETLQDPDDPTVLEIDQAIRTRRDIIPLLANGFSFNSTFMPGAINVLRRYHGLTLTPESLPQTVETLMTARFTREIFGKTLPVPEDQRAAAQARVEAAAREPVPSDDALRAEVAFNRALAHARQDRAAKLADYDETLRLNPRHIFARYERAQERRRSGDDAGAFEDYDEALRQYPAYYHVVLSRAELHFARGAYANALADYDRGLALLPDNLLAITGKALTLHALGRADEAHRLWLPLLVRDERFSDAVWVGRELRLSAVLIDETHRLVQRLHAVPDASDR
jgi:tetratricopeptide (TPR) repeat protein